MNMADKRFPAADAHCDFLYGMVQNNYDIAAPEQGQSICLSHMRTGGVKLQFFAVWVDMLLKRSPLNQCLCMIDAYYRMLEANPGFVPFSKDFDPLGGKIATVLTIEGAEAIEGSLENLRVLYRLGVRAMTLTWNYVNSLAYPAVKRSKRGLSDAGKKVVKEMCRIGMAIDISHLNDYGIDEVLSIADRPVFASHSNARALCAHPRCIRDDHIRAVAEAGGVIGVNFYHKQLTDEKNADVDDVIRHIEHIAEIGGIACVALGSDFDGMDKYIDGLEDSRGLLLIANKLVKLGLNDEQIGRIMYRNLAGYMGRFC